MSTAPTLMPSIAVFAQTGHSQEEEVEEEEEDKKEEEEGETQTAQSESISEDKISASPVVNMDVPSGQGTCSVHAAAPRAAEFEGGDGDDATGDPDDDNDDASSGISRRLELAQGLDEVEELLLDSL